MNRINRLFEYLEDFILSIIALMTLGAVGFELFDVYQRGTITLADLLLMFIYAEVLGMVAIYFRSHVLPVIYPLFIGVICIALVPHTTVLISSISDNWFMTALPNEITARHYEMIFNEDLATIGIKNSFLFSSLFENRTTLDRLILVVS